MTDQLAFDLAPLVHAEPDSTLTIQQRFERFHADNPWVYSALESLTADWLTRGHRRVGIKQMFEVVRWQYGRSTSGDSFKVNNDFTSRYARALLDAHPEWADAIEVRELRAA
ncbi:MAG TPA: hypothetical protein VJL80_06305 [Aeromicrobium sp.]|nr:hypothetical protein [Aeromicrobium sp.]HKY57631.1 hypothetical protein [Aeromicrobium sp.]